MNICFHHNDADGRCAAAIIGTLHTKENIVYEEMNYSFDKRAFIERLRNKRFGKIYIVDFSFPAYIFEFLSFISTEIIWIDHHISARTTLWNLWFDNKFGGLRDINKSAAMLAWEYVNGYEEQSPLFVDWVQDYDLWKFLFPNTEFFALGIKDEPVSTFSALLKNPKNSLPFVNIGRILLEEQNKRIANVITTGEKRNIAGFSAYFINTNVDLSKLGNLICKDYFYAVAVIWYYANGNTYYSLRSINVDVSKIARLYGGGGHKLAAGFSLKSYVTPDKLEDYLNDEKQTRKEIQ